MIKGPIYQADMMLKVCAPNSRASNSNEMFGASQEFHVNVPSSFFSFQYYLLCSLKFKLKDTIPTFMWLSKGLIPGGSKQWWQVTLAPTDFSFSICVMVSCFGEKKQFLNSEFFLQLNGMWNSRKHVEPQRLGQVSWVWALDPAMPDRSSSKDGGRGILGGLSENLGQTPCWLGS